MKRILKIVGSLLLLLLVVFLLTGLVVKETNYKASVTIKKPVEEVFTTFNDAAKLKEWMTSIKSFEAIDEKEGKVGSTYKIIVLDANGNDFEMKEKVIAFEPNKRVALEFDAQSMFKIDDIQFTSNGGSTTITNNATCKGTSYLYKCMFPYFKGMFQKLDQENLDKFKKYIEN